MLVDIRTSSLLIRIVPFLYFEARTLTQRCQALISDACSLSKTKPVIRAKAPQLQSSDFQYAQRNSFMDFAGKCLAVVAQTKTYIRLFASRPI